MYKDKVFKVTVLGGYMLVSAKTKSGAINIALEFLKNHPTTKVSDIEPMELYDAGINGVGIIGADGHVRISEPAVMDGSNYDLALN